jgi:DNA-binding transcriptional LysR family regulator
MVDSHVDNHWLSLEAIMRIQQLQLLLALAEHGSLRASAQVLHVTQPALTKALRQLEEEVGAPLVVRTPRGVRLAPAGEILAAHAATALRELDQARADIDWQVRHERTRLAVGLSPVAGILLAPGAIARFCSRVQGVRLRLVDAVFPRMQALVRSGEIDLGIGPLPAGEHSLDLVAQPLFDSANVVVARLGHPLAGASHLADLAAAGWVLVGPRGGPGDPASG